MQKDSIYRIYYCNGLASSWKFLPFCSVAHTTPRTNLDFFRHFLIASSYEEVLLIQQTIDVQILSLG